MDDLETIFHHDGTVEYWDVYRQMWVRTDDPDDDALARMSRGERALVLEHVRAEATTP